MSDSVGNIILPSSRSDQVFVGQFWSGVSFDELREIDDGTGVSDEIFQTESNDIPLLLLCPSAIRIAVEKTDEQWLKARSLRLRDFLAEIYYSADETLSARFGNFFISVSAAVKRIGNESDTSKRKLIFSSELYKLQTDQRMELDVFASELANPLTVHERRHTLVMLLDFFVSELLRLTSDQSTTEPPASPSATATNSMEEKALYYVGGFLIKKLLRRYASPKTPLEEELKKLLELCVAGRHFSLPEAAQWTDTVDRGHLTFITVPCYDLFADLERFASSSGNACPSIESAFNDAKIQLGASRISEYGQFTSDAVDSFKRNVIREFFTLRGKATAKKKLETAIVTDGLLQDRRGIRGKLHRLETNRTDSEQR